MSKYRCVVVTSSGENFIPYSGISFQFASEAMRQYEAFDTVYVQKTNGDSWDTIMGVFR